MNLTDIDLSFATVENFFRLFLVFTLVLYVIFSLLVVKQVNVLTGAIQTEDGFLLTATGLILFIAGGVLLAWFLATVFL